MGDSIFYDTMQDIGSPTETVAPVDSLFYETEKDLGPLPTGWWMDIDEVPIRPTPPRPAPTPIDPYADYPTIVFDRSSAQPSLWRRIMAQPVSTFWVVIAVATIALVGSAWMLL